MRSSLLIHQNVPYFAQWESRSLIGDIAYRRIDAGADPLWQNSGAESLEEYSEWSRHACGMACLKMVLAYKLGQDHKLMELLRDCRSYGGYVVENDNIRGLYYAPFVCFIHHHFGLEGNIITKMSYDDIVKEILNGSLVMASVNKEIRKPEIIPDKRGGHLILVVGIDTDKNLIYFHNPSGHTADTQEYVGLPFSIFEKFFAHRGIVIR